MSTKLFKKRKRKDKPKGLRKKKKINEIDNNNNEISILNNNKKNENNENNNISEISLGQTNASKKKERFEATGSSATAIDNTRVDLKGPMRAPTFVRKTAFFDYQPDICKDYKETGYCGWGDTCIFLHDRGDHKSGWQIEKEWEEKQRKKAEGMKSGILLNDDDDDDDNNSFQYDNLINRNLIRNHERNWDDKVKKKNEGKENEKEINDDDGLPFACFICREPFNNPIVTLCGHYFCRECAATNHQKNPTCIICGKKTEGVFNYADNIVRKMNRIKKLKEEKKKNDNIIDNDEENKIENNKTKETNHTSLGTWSKVVT